MTKLIIIVLLAIVNSIAAIRLSSIYHEPPVPVSKGPRSSVVLETFTQKVDNFNPANADTYEMVKHELSFLPIFKSLLIRHNIPLTNNFTHLLTIKIYVHVHRYCMVIKMVSLGKQMGDKVIC